MDEAQLSGQPEVPFDDVVIALRDEEQPFPARYLYRLSALEDEELGLISRAWFGLSQQRRLGLLEDLETLAESNTLLQFDAINRIALGDDDPGVRVTAIRSLWPSEDGSFIPTLLDLLESDESSEVRAQAAAAPHIRCRALESLGFSSRPEVPELIEHAFEDDSEEWAASALYAMGRSADDRWAPLVIDRLKDSNLDLSREAARAAGELELSGALPALGALLQGE